MRKRIFITSLIIIVFMPLWMWLAWLLSAKKQMNIFILDKTVLTEKCDEHRSLNWVLTNEKFVKADMNLYQTEKDYMGFFPKDYDQYEVNDLKGKKEAELEEMSKNLDMLYYADIYGIYYNDWYSDDWAGLSKDEKILNLFKNIFGKKSSLERSPLIYGGIDDEDVTLLQKMKDKKKLIITEFNLLASPSGTKNRLKIEKMFNIKWSQWVGRYFTSLDTVTNPELPPWVYRLYKAQHNGSWPFKNSGIVFVHEDETIAILEDETHLDLETPYIRTPEKFQDKYDIPDGVIYPFWFDITYSKANNIVSYYEIHSNTKGDSVLNHHSIPKRFPAVIESPDNLFYYFCGDYSDNPININYMAKLKGIKFFRFLMYDKGDRSDRNRFFWVYYNRLVAKILNNYYDTLKK